MNKKRMNRLERLPNYYDNFMSKYISFSKKEK